MYYRAIAEKALDLELSSTAGQTPGFAKYG
jgi:hypothetical protein